MRDSRGRARVWWWSQGKEVPERGSPLDDMIGALFGVEERKTEAQARWLERIALSLSPQGAQAYFELSRATRTYLDANRRGVYDEAASQQQALSSLLEVARKELTTLHTVQRAHHRRLPRQR